MLKLKNIKKDYETGTERVKALKGISLEFRDSEFVSILGQSGCGKTTLLNIIGGLDNYTSGNLIISGKSTKDFKDRDWDTYRNHRVGFVFQSYNLIPHQTVFSNVELALTLSGVSKQERRKRVRDALKQVGLLDQANKKPNQMSGGQMQRVAIARALVNDPEILLADEPTGALDSKTSSQVMDILKDISKDRLIIMVTHNAELAKEYSSRIITLKDGLITDDTNPFDSEKEKIEENVVEQKKKNKKTSMSFKTALSLSLNNLLTKKGRTLLTSFAGSIGIIGIALILSLSHGVQEYINGVEEETLSSYPLVIQDNAIEMDDFLSMMMGTSEKKEHDDDKIYSNNVMSGILNTMTAKTNSNNLKSFKEYIESTDEILLYTSAIGYGYDLNLQIYKDSSSEVYQVNPSTVLDSVGMGSGDMSSFFMSTDSFSELFDNQDLNESMFDLVAGSWPKNHNEIVLIVDENNEIIDYTLYTLGLLDASELKNIYRKIMNGEEFEIKEVSYTIDELLKLKFKLLLNTDYYEKENGLWIDKRNDKEYMLKKLADAEDIVVSGIIKPSEESIVTASGGALYTKELVSHVINRINESEIVKDQKKNTDINVLTGLKFSEKQEFSIEDLTPKQQAYLAGLSPEELTQVIETYTKQAGATINDVLRDLGSMDLENPSSIYLYPKDFDSKEEITNLINQYNTKEQDAGRDENVINFNDVVGSMMSGVSTIVNVISYVLMAFVAISLIVSSIMIGIITYISVLERTKEIGILRAIGASKKDISRVFNAETIIVGFTSGAMGIIVTILLNIPINVVIKNLANISNASVLPWNGAIILILISVLLTSIAGLMPAKVASKKDPVVALRTE